MITGNAGTLRSFLTQEPDLAHARAIRPHHATLLHYLGANGVEEERQKCPRNAVEIAQILFNAGADVDALAEIYGRSTTLGLVASSIHPRRAGIQIPLMDILLKHGAAIDGVPGTISPLLSALHNGRPEAAEFLARRGAQLNLESAAGVGLLDVVVSFFHHDGSLKANATKTQMEAGFMWACEYGRESVAEFLLDKGVNLRAGENAGQTALHWAVVGGQQTTIKLLVKRGAPFEAKNVYGATALGQALWSAVNGDPDTDYMATIELLLAAGARVEDGSVAWLAEQGGRSNSEKSRIIELLRSSAADS